MTAYVLVHGAWHGAWCWDKVVPVLAAAGHTAVAVDLPGHGSDTTPIEDLGLGDYVDRTSQVLAQQPEPVVLVGHSHGGATISMTAERHPEKVKALVYVCAFLLRDGQSIADLVAAGEQSLVKRNMASLDGGRSLVIRDDALRDGLFGDCTDADFEWARSRLVPEPSSPRTTPVTVTDELFGRVPRVYVECLRDNAVPLSMQREMCAESPCEKVITMDTGHSPFISAPEELAAHLMAV